MPWLLLIFGAACALLGLNVRVPLRRPMTLAMMSFFAAWIPAEAPLHVIAVQAALAVTIAASGGLDAWPGVLGLGLVALGWWPLIAAWRAAGTTPQAIEAALGSTPPAPRLWPRLVWPFSIRTRRSVRITRNTRFGDTPNRRLALDVWYAADPAPSTRGRPVLLYIHGGGWFIGFRRFQGMPLLNRMTQRGWVCFSAGYRLSPRATFPDHVVDVKQALAWVRAHAADYGGDPDRIYLCGNSAGGHLASLTALTPGLAAWQAGFEDDARPIQGCVSFYGIYDLTHREQQWPHAGLQRLLRRVVMKRHPVTERAAYEQASPWDHVTPDAPAFLLVHGDRDTAVPVAEARAFAAHFERVVPGRCTLLEAPGAQHAFDVFLSRRTLWIVEAVARYLDDLDHTVVDAGAGDPRISTPT